MTTRKKLTATAVTLLAFIGVVTAGTLAVFTDQDQVGSNAFATGEISLTTNPTSAVVSFTNMMPGDKDTDDLVVTNDGTGELRYALSATATNADSKGLKDQLVLTVKTGVTGVDCADFDTSGTAIYSGDLDGGTTGKIFGDNTQGSQAGDRTLATSASETLCFRVELPLTTGNAYENSATTATFTFDSEQTKNNP